MQVAGQWVHKYLTKRKGLTVDKGKGMNDYITVAASEVGLEYDFDKAIINNTLKAHRLSHLAAKHGLQNKVKEALFAFYYIGGKTSLI